MTPFKHPCNESILAFNNAIVNKDPESKKEFHCVLLYDSELEIGKTPLRPYVYVRRGKPYYFKSYHEALSYYCNIPNPASKMLSANSENELQELIDDYDRKMMDSAWVKENLIPYM